jgi:OOP family OmpA-OmpF porin
VKRKAFALLALICAPAFAQEGYVTQPAGGHVMNPYGLCWRSSFWTPQHAVSPCDAPAQPAPAPQAAAPVQPVVLAEPAPAPAPAPVPIPVAKQEPAPAAQPVYEKVSLSADVLFDFGKATLKDGGRQQLDDLADRLRGSSLDEIRIVGHADRIGNPHYNKRLSEERANTVRTYLESRTQARSIQTAGKGSADPVSGASCRGLGAEQGSNRRLVQCLQADRRVDIELLGVRTVSQPGAAPAGGTQPASFSGPGR